MVVVHNNDQEWNANNWWCESMNYDIYH